MQTTTPVFTVAEVAEALDITVKCAYHLIYDGELDSIKQGRRLMVTRKALVEYADFAGLAA